MTATEELVVLLDSGLHPIGTAPQFAVHNTETPLHLAFACYVFDNRGRVLVTRRAYGKRTWPGEWTNSVCGHPGPHEDMAAAIHHRARTGLGIGIHGLAPALPDFRYRAVASSGIVENEFCPVWTARTTSVPAPSPDEVAEWHWLDWLALVDIAARAPWLLSPWSREQIPQLAAFLDQ